jgi:RHS repeat-associated protein
MTNLASARRGGLRLRLSLLRVSTILCTGLAPAIVALPATAQVAPVRQSVDGNGVDLFLGTVNYDGPTLSAGQDEQTGLAYRKIGRGGYHSGDNLWASLYVYGSTTIISFGGASDSFTLSGSSYVPTEGKGATLSLSGTLYTYVARDGTVIHFDKTKQGAYPYQTAIGLVTDITRPTGAVLTYTYDSLYYCVSYKELSNGYTCLQHGYAYRAGSVSSKGGYKLTFQYNPLEFPPDESAGEFPDFGIWGTAVGVTMTNTAIAGSSARSQAFTTSSSGGNNYLTITDPMNRVTTFRTSSTGFGIKRPGKTSEDITISYSGGRVSNVTSPIGTTTYAYSDAGGIRTTTVTDPGGHATVYTFDIALQRMKSVTNPLGKITSWDYDTSGRVTKVTAPEGNYTQYTYDARGNVTETRNVAKSGPGASDIATTAGYDTSCTDVATCNSPNWTRDAKGNQTDYTYDSSTGNLLTVTAPAPTTGATRPKSTSSYTTSGGVQLLTGTSICQTTASCVGTADEVKTTIAYNSNLLPTSVSKGAGDGSLTATTTIGYDDVGNATSVDGPLSGSADTTTYRYDADREVVGVIAPDPDGSGSLKRKAVRTTYNDRGIVTLAEVGTVNGTSDTDWSGFTSLQQVATALDAADRKYTVAMNAGGTTYALTQYSYDSDGRIDCTAVRMKSGSYGSLPTSACTATTGSGDADRISRATYDNANRVTKTTSAYGTTAASDDATVTYSDNGRVATATDANGNKTTYEYDGFDRLLKTRYPSTTKGAGTSSTTDYELLAYDANGNVTSRTLRDATSIAYSYDNLNRLTLKNLPGSELDVSYTYDSLSRPLSAATSAQTLSFTYDALGRNLTQVGPLGTVTAQFDVAGRRTQLTYPGSFYVTYDYLVTGQVAAIKESGTTTLASFIYDDLGRRTSLTRGNGVTTSYSFDSVSRLSSLGQDLSGSGDDLTLGFSYNSASQIASTTRSNTGYSWTGAVNVARGYTSNGLNQYSAAGGTSFAFDTRGNLTTSGSLSFTYSSENLLLTGPSSAALTYDPLMRLYQTSATGFATNKLAYDGMNLIAEYSNLGTLQKRYVFGPGADEPLVEYDASGNKSWLIADERGSIIAKTNASGVSTATNTYDEYGIPGSGNDGRFQYTGQTWLGELGMYYYKARVYSPTLGRFMQTDPIGYGDGINMYNYVHSDPLSGKDPSGLMDYYCTTIDSCTDSNGNKVDPNTLIDKGDTVTYGRNTFTSDGNEGGRMGFAGTGVDVVVKFDSDTGDLWVEYYSAANNNWIGEEKLGQAFFSGGGGSYGLVGGVFYSHDTGWGGYFGLGSPGFTATGGIASDTTDYLTGSSWHVSPGTFGTGGNSTSSAITFGAQSPGVAYTYGITSGQVVDKFNEATTTMSNGIYNELGRPYDGDPAFPK